MRTPGAGAQGRARDSANGPITGGFCSSARQPNCWLSAMPKFRLLDIDHDSPLAVGLIMATAVVFQQPLRFALNAVGDIEQRYHLDLLPALVVLCVVFMFHQDRKRQESRAAALAADTVAQLERSRVSELQELVGIGQSLANALEFKEIEQAFWRHLPSPLRQYQLSIAMQVRSGWRSLVHDTASGVDGARVEEIAAKAAGRFGVFVDGAAPAVIVESFLCFPVYAGRAVIGVAVLRDTPEHRDERVQQMCAPVLAFVGIAARNIQLLAESKEDSVRDSLTRWFNRGHAIEVLRNDLRRGVRSGNRASVIMFDLDGFKTLNDTLGHLHGDSALQAVARGVSGLLRGSDLRCRYGGDEFLVILPETPIAGAAQVAENVRQAISSLDLSTGKPRQRLTCSIGVAAAAEGELEPEQVIARADAALYNAKRAGRNRVFIDGDEPVPLPAGKMLRLVASSAP